jgi:predicted metal-dependent enzyme (double-stranded beta helix superfamily)
VREYGVPYLSGRKMPGPGGYPGANWPLTAHMEERGYSPRQYAMELLAVLDRYSGNMVAAFDEVMPLTYKLMEGPALTDFGVTRDANHAPMSQWIYFDYELEVTLSSYHRSVALPVHNHGTWEYIAPYRGEFAYTSYRRIGGDLGDGRARLELVDERVLRPGDAAVTALPPDDIHTFTPLSDDMLLLGMNHGPLAPERSYFDVDAGTYEIRDSRAWRRTNPF